MSEDNNFIKDKIILIENDTIVFEQNKALKVNEIVKPYLDKYSQGDTVEFKVYGDPKQVMFIKKAGTFSQKSKPKLPTYDSKEAKLKAGFANISGKIYATLEVLLNTMHKTYGNNWRLKTELIEHNRQDKFVIVKARADILDDEGRVMGSFSGIGDASKDNVAANMLPSYIRMGETRAIVRALRWATNVAEAAVDELPGENVKDGNQKTNN